MKKNYKSIITTNLYLLYTVAFASFKQRSAYRTVIFVSLLVGPVALMVQSYIWTSLFNDQTIVNGLTLENMLQYYAYAMLIKTIVMDNLDVQMQMSIQNGTLFIGIIKPISYFTFELYKKVGSKILQVGLEIIPLIILIKILFRIPLFPAYPMFFLISVIISFHLIFLLNICVGVLSFWIIRTDGLRRIISLLLLVLSGGLLPLSFFPMFFQKVLFFLPFQYILYVPIRIAIGSYQMGDITLSVGKVIIIQALVLGIVFFITRHLWQMGLKKYTGVGQ